MKHTHSIRSVFIATLCTLASLWIFSAAHAQVAVIVHPSNSSELDEGTIKKIFLGKTTKFNDGKIALPLNGAKDSAPREYFNNTVLGRTTNQVNSYWSKLVFTGKGEMPKEVDSDAEVVSTVAANQGAIGYVDPSAVNDSVKVVANF
ncbi:substrate-binding domain-containing protein [Aestuariibacter sp. AA17]|uniref:Substrate-binding domain-containing protein n=1 Tax=Fluctibacter corallii TaxID=2984329 RepID=A0ABT3A4F4_9ALTE|nr:substrate-binding domain-containing protein [Aestuariibacter sp. AA17]MCV2883538.1 substrate-binding domain-containing protein [Aestuariibacter sp. AA17]